MVERVIVVGFVAGGVSQGLWERWRAWAIGFLSRLLMTQ